MITNSGLGFLAQVAGWSLVPLSFGMIAWTVGSTIGWTIRPLLFRSVIEKRQLPLARLNIMLKFTERFLAITAPKEAELEMVQTRNEGAVWPNDCWALLYLSINRKDAFWGAELQSEPFYQSSLKEQSVAPKTKKDGVLILLNVLNGQGSIDDNGDYRDHSKYMY
jgi:hypothetical protein